MDVDAGTTAAGPALEIWLESADPYSDEPSALAIMQPACLLPGWDSDMALLDAVIASPGEPARDDSRSATAIAEAMHTLEAVQRQPDDPAWLKRLLARKVQQRLHTAVGPTGWPGAIADPFAVLDLPDDPAVLKTHLAAEVAAAGCTALASPRPRVRRKARRGLSESRLARLPAGRHSDGRRNGLHLRVTDDGCRTWVVRLTDRWSLDAAARKRAGRDPRRVDYSIGTLADLSLAAARDIAARYAGLARAGKDPRFRSQKPRFAEIFEDMIRRRRPEWKLPRGKSISTTEERARRLYVTWLEPRFADLPVDAISSRMMVELLQVAADGRKTRAREVYMFAKHVFDVAIALGHCAVNPAVQAAPVIKLAHAKTPMRSVPYREAPAAYRLLWDFAQAAPAPGLWTAPRALMFTILTGCRTEEVLGLRWGEVNLQEKWLDIPAERRKSAGGGRFIVPLSAQALAIIHEMPRPRSDKDLVFRFESRGRLRHLRRGALNEVARDRINMSGTPHGWRSTLVTWLNEEKQAREELRRAAVGHHVAKESSDKPYDRATLVAERRPLMQEYADYRNCPGLISAIAHA